MSTKQDERLNGEDGKVRHLPAEERGARVAVGSYRTPWGTGTISVSEGRLVGVELPSAQKSGGAEQAPSPGDAGLCQEKAVPLGAPAQRSSPVLAPADQAALDHWAKQLEAYFQGEKLAWSAGEIALDRFALGAFERSVYETLLSIPPAVTVSYGVLAEMAGYPRAARAVGNAMAANPIPVVVPCHRVVRSDGSLGSYGNDPAWKERLLMHERTHAPIVATGRDR